MVRERWIGLLLAAVLVSPAFGLGVCGQASSSASATSTAGSAEVSVGGFVFEIGSRIAVEIFRDEPASCLPSVTILSLDVLAEDGTVLRSEPIEPAADAAEWLGTIDLAEPDGAPWSVGTYRIVVTTSVGTFAAGIEVAEASALRERGRFSASASVCGLSLRVYRLVTEQDAAAQLSLRVGDRLLVALEGNATTGYAWSNVLLYEYAVLRESAEVEYRPQSALPGSPGVFLFRYVAVDIGPQAFRYEYRRSWESGEPLRTVEFSADVV